MSFGSMLFCLCVEWSAKEMKRHKNNEYNGQNKVGERRTEGTKARDDQKATTTTTTTKKEEP